MYEIRRAVDAEAAYTFYHAYNVEHPAEGELTLMSVSREQIASWFCGEGRITLGAYDGDRLIGLASGLVSVERRTGFLSYLCVAPDQRRRGIGTRLLAELEGELALHPSVEKLDAVFYNPVQLPWYIPNGGGDWHPCLPGVDEGSALHAMLSTHGWGTFATQCGYYRPMRDYMDQPSIAQTRARLSSEGIELTLYDPALHHGLPELFDNIRNPGWKAHVLAHLDLPIVVAVDTNADGLVVGYTGPLSVVGRPGRGNFCGIGVRTDYRGRGIGKPVFCEMCARHRDGGADFMSLYTGIDNPARHIYEAAGFSVVRRFADMRKSLG